MPTQAGPNRSSVCEPTWVPSSANAPLLTRRSLWHPSWPPTRSPTAARAGREAGSSSAPKYAPATTHGSKSRTRAASGPAITPGMAGPTGSTSSRPSPETAAGVSAAMPPSAGSHGPGLTGPATLVSADDGLGFGAADPRSDHLRHPGSGSHAGRGARARSSTTCGRYLPSLASAPAASSTASCLATRTPCGTAESAHVRPLRGSDRRYIEVSL
jgi:hypothetical protein